MGEQRLFGKIDGVMITLDALGFGINDQIRNILTDAIVQCEEELITEEELIEQIRKAIIHKEEIK